jgi:hypothetical protein
MSIVMAQWLYLLLFFNLKSRSFYLEKDKNKKNVVFRLLYKQSSMLATTV